MSKKLFIFIRPRPPQAYLPASVFYSFFLPSSLNGFEGIDGGAERKSLIYRTALKMNKSKTTRKPLCRGEDGKIKISLPFVNPTSHLAPTIYK